MDVRVLIGLLSLADLSLGVIGVVLFVQHRAIGAGIVALSLWFAYRIYKIIRKIY